MDEAEEPRVQHLHTIEVDRDGVRYGGLTICAPVRATREINVLAYSPALRPDLITSSEDASRRH
jgi:hypothetical protein